MRSNTRARNASSVSSSVPPINETVVANPLNPGMVPCKRSGVPGSRLVIAPADTAASGMVVAVRPIVVCAVV